MYKYRQVGVFFCLFSLFCFCFCFAQEKIIVQPIFPSAGNSYEKEAQLESLAKDVAGDIRNSGILEFAYPFQAVRENDLSYCNSASDPKDCQEKVSWYLELRALAEGNCRKVEDFPLGVCEALPVNDCESLNGVAKDTCKAFLMRDPELLYKAEKSNRSRGTLADAELRINIYSGFKYYSLAACDKAEYSKGQKYLRKTICRILFDNKSAQNTIDSLALDLAYFQLAKEIKNDPKICDKIQDGSIRNACRGSSVKSFSDILN